MQQGLLSALIVVSAPTTRRRFRFRWPAAAYLLVAASAWLMAPTAARGDEDFYSLTEGNYWWASNGNDPIAKGLDRCATNGALKCLAFMPQGDWVILFGAGGVWSNNVELPAVKKLNKLQNGVELKWVSFTAKGDPVAFWNQNEYWSSGDVPAGALKKIAEVAKKRGELRSIAFSPSGGWVLLHDAAGAAFDRVSDDLAQRLRQEAKQGAAVHCVAFTPSGDWIVLASDGWWTSNPDLAASNHLKKIVGEGKKPRWVVVEPAEPTTARYKLDVRPAQRVKAVLTTDFGHPRAKVKEWIVYAPLIPSLPSQHPVRTRFTPEAKVVRESSPLGRSLNLARVTDGRAELHAVLTIEATLIARRLAPLAAGEQAPESPKLSPELAKKYLRDSPTVELDSESLRDWMRQADLKRNSDESDMAFARRAFAYIKHHCDYEWPTTSERVSQVCARGKSDCGGIASLFVAVMRANKIPARALAGRWAKSQTEGVQGQWHVKAEFFALGLGWVPVDASAAVNDKAGGDFDCFGADAGDFIVMADDLDQQIDTFHFGKVNMATSQGISHWWTGEGDGKESFVKEWWTVEKLE